MSARSQNNIQNNKQTANRVQQPEQIDLLALFGTLLDRKWFIICLTVIFTLGGIGYALFSTPIFKATALIQVEDSKPGVPGLEDMTSLFEGASEAVTEIELLKSRNVIGEAVNNLKLYIQAEPKLFPVIGGRSFRKFTPEHEADLAEPSMGAASYAWGGESINIFRFEVPKGYLGQTFEIVVGENQTINLVNPDGETVLSGKVGQELKNGFYELTIRSLNARPKTHFDIVRKNKLTTILQLQKDIAVSEKGKKSGILNLSYQDKSPEYSKSILNEIANIYVRQNVDRSSAEAQKSLEFLQVQLPDTKKQLEAAEKQLNDYQINEKSINITLETQGVLEQMVELDTKLQELNLKRLEISRKFKSNHPIYQGLMNQIAEINKQKNEFASKVSDLPETQQELLRLTRDVEVNNKIYLFLLEKTQELDIVRAGTIGNVRIIDTADVDTTEPVKPKKPLIVVVATLLGGFLAIAIVLIQKAMHRGIENPDEIEELGMPVYASIPDSKDQHLLDVRDKSKKRKSSKHPLLAVENPADLAIEALRSLRTSIHFAMMEAKNNIITISGPAPSVGKSFVTANFGAVLAQAGQKVLVIDGDMRKGHLIRYFQVAKDKGLSEVITNQISLNDAIQSTKIENLDVLVRGQVPPNPSELLMHPRFAEIMQQVSKLYDIVLIDTPPILAVTDPSIIAAQAGTTLMVGRFGQNSIKEIEVAQERFEKSGIDVKGFILNAVEKKASNAYGYGYGYYNYSYESDKK